MQFVPPFLIHHEIMMFYVKYGKICTNTQFHSNFCNNNVDVTWKQSLGHVLCWLCGCGPVWTWEACLQHKNTEQALLLCDITEVLVENITKLAENSSIFFIIPIWYFNCIHLWYYKMNRLLQCYLGCCSCPGSVWCLWSVSLIWHLVASPEEKNNVLLIKERYLQHVHVNYCLLIIKNIYIQNLHQV